MKPQKHEDRYNYYAEQMSKFMADAGLIPEDETNWLETYIRGCA